MNSLILNSLRENVRNKTFYVVILVSTILFSIILLGGGLYVNGRKLTTYKELIPVSLQLINFMGCIIAIFMSMNTIPKEYERKTTHLILIRGIKREKLNLSLALSNMASAMFGTLILSIATYVLVFMSKNYSDVLKVTGAVMLIMINVLIIAAFTSVLSMFVPSILTGFLGICIYGLGIFHNQLELFAELSKGAVKVIINLCLYFIPDFYSITSEASKLINYGTVNLHVILKGILYLYIILCLFLIPSRREV